MRRRGAGRVAAALALGLAVSAAAAQEPNGDTRPRPAARASWWGGWFGGKDRAEEADVEKAPPRPSAHQIAQERERQEKALWRRLKVCERLAEVALQTNDQDLSRKAEQLEARVWDIYRRRTSGLGGGSTDRDESVLEEHLKTGTGRPTFGREGEDARRSASLREDDR